MSKNPEPDSAGKAPKFGSSKKRKTFIIPGNSENTAFAKKHPHHVIDCPRSARKEKAEPRETEITTKFGPFYLKRKMQMPQKRQLRDNHFCRAPPGPYTQSKQNFTKIQRNNNNGHTLIHKEPPLPNPPGGGLWGEGGLIPQGRGEPMLARHRSMTPHTRPPHQDRTKPT